jgi:hypothetical protein
MTPPSRRGDYNVSRKKEKKKKFKQISTLPPPTLAGGSVALQSRKKVETFIILVILVFELVHVRFLYGFFNKGVAVVRLIFRTAVD